MRRAALAGGPLLFAATVALPPVGGLDGEAWRVAGLAAWMATWWLTAVVPLEATALIPIVVLPLSTGLTIRAAVGPYADPVIFLFLGGFLLGATLERWALHRRFALATVRAVGTDAPRVVLAFMVVSAVASMWISNTATAVVMLPIAMAVARSRRPAPDGSEPHADGFPTALLLAVAYGASIGGVATLIGSPPNAIFAGAASELLGRDIGFGWWLRLGLSVSIPMFWVGWLVLVRLFRVAGDVPGLADTLDRERQRLGTLGGGERFVLGVFAATAIAWVLRAPKTIGPLRVPGLSDLLPGITDSAIAIGAALVLLTVPLRGQRFSTALDWNSARRIQWGILLLFGGGLALARAFETSGLTAWIGGNLTALEGAALPVVLLATTALFVLLTELTSNTATAALAMPLMAGVARGVGVDGLPLMAAAALAASMAFMLPVATPPNAIVFSSGAITTGQMARAGIWLNLAAIVVITFTTWLWIG